MNLQTSYMEVELDEKQSFFELHLTDTKKSRI